MASIQAKKGKNGKKTYYVVVCLKGRHKWIRAGTIRDAKILKREIESLEESKRMEKLGFAKRDKRIDSFFQDYMEYMKPRAAANTVKRYRAAINTFVTFLRMLCPQLRLLSQIKPEHIELYQQKRLESIDLKIAADGEKSGNHRNKRLPLPQTVNYEVGVLRSAFIWANDREFIPNVPTKKVKKLRSSPKKEARIMAPVECRLFLKTARELAKADKRLKIYYQAYQFMLNTGLRSGELCSLTWDDVNLDTGLVKIRPKPGWAPKSYSREFFLNETCIRILKRLSDSGGNVFQDLSGRQLDPDGLRRALIKIAGVAGLRGLTRVHDLRHTFSSLMQMRGVDPGTVATILGHRDLGTTRIYTHQTEEHLKKSIGRLRIG